MGRYEYYAREINWNKITDLRGEDNEVITTDGGNIDAIGELVVRSAVFDIMTDELFSGLIAHRDTFLTINLVQQENKNRSQQ